MAPQLDWQCATIYIWGCYQADWRIAIILVRDNNMAEYRERMVVSGMVQGVGFRYFACRLAQEYPVTGYVANLPNGDVEIVAEGTKEAVRSFLLKAGRGPGYAHVRSVKSFVEEAKGNFKVFGVGY